MDIITETPRLYFREFSAADFEGIYELDADPEVHQFLGKNPITNRQQAKDTISFIRQQYQENGIGRWAVIEKETDSFVGWGGFKLITGLTNGHINYYDLGYRFLKSAWGKGFATESCRAVLEYGFNELQLPVVYAIADIHNLQSQKVLNKCGFLQNGNFKYEGLPHYWFELAAPRAMGDK